MNKRKNKSGVFTGGAPSTLLSSNSPETTNVGSGELLFFENLVWLTSEEARVYLRLSSRAALRQLVYRGVLPRPGKIGRSYRFKRTDLDDFIESSRLLKKRRY